MRTYQLSLNKQEVQIAEVTSDTTNTTSGTYGKNPTTLVFPQDGKVRLYFWTLDNNLPTKLDLTYNNNTISTTSANWTYYDTGINVKAKEKVKETMWEMANNTYHKSYNWEKPIDGTKCGNPSKEKLIDISSKIQLVQNSQQSIVSVQCWSDWDTGSTEPYSDYDDYLVIVSYEVTGGAFGQNPTTLVFPKDGEVRLYFWTLDNNLPTKFDLTYNGNTTSITSANWTYYDTGINVKAKDQVKEAMWELGQKIYKKSYNWSNPVDGAKCGNPSKEALIDISEKLQLVQNHQQPIVSVQCWSDWDTGSTEPYSDYDDYLVILSYK